MAWEVAEAMLRDQGTSAGARQTSVGVRQFCDGPSQTPFEYLLCMERDLEI